MGVDTDVEEQFHMLLLHEAEQAYCGIELPRDLLEELESEVTFKGLSLEVHWFMHFGHLVFGWQLSPYLPLLMQTARCIELVLK